jgi:hypothetical protein
VQQLRDSIVATMETERLKDLGYALITPERRSSEYLQKFVESEIEKWAAVIKAAGVAPQ